MPDGRLTAPIAGSLVLLDRQELHRVRQENDLQVGTASACRDQFHEHEAIEKLDSVIAAEMLTLVVPVVGVGLRVALSA